MHGYHRAVEKSHIRTETHLTWPASAHSPYLLQSYSISYFSPRMCHGTAMQW